jgi:hypothetical protein
MSLVAIRLKLGSVFNIYALEENGRCDLLDFLERINNSESARIQRFLDWTKDRGLITNTEQSKKLENGIYYFRTRGGVRVFYFTDGNKVLVCTNGYTKKKDKLDPREIQRARILRQKYNNAKDSNTLKFEENPI